MERWKDRKFRLLLWQEDPSHIAAIEELKAAGYKFAAILHDKDVWSEDDPELGDHIPGELKKPHWHVVVKFQNPIWSSSLAKQLAIKECYIKDCKNTDGALLYLVHATHPDKYQYDLQEVFGELVPALGKLLADDDEGARVLTLVGMIDDIQGICTYRQVLIKACNAGLYGEFRRLGMGAKYLIDEHNAEYYDEFRRREDNDLARDRFSHFLANPPEMTWVERGQRLDRGGYVPPPLE